VAAIALVRPSLDRLDAHAEALRRGAAAAEEERARIADAPGN
jgi:hypothetical protein